MSKRIAAIVVLVASFGTTELAAEEVMTFEVTDDDYDPEGEMTFEVTDQDYVGVTDGANKAPPAAGPQKLESAAAIPGLTDAPVALDIPDAPEDLGVAKESSSETGLSFNAQLASWANGLVTRNPNQPMYEAVGRIDAGAGYRLSSSLSSTANLRVRYGRDMEGKKSENDFSFEPREIYVTYQGDRVSLTLGQQVTRWGVTDFFSPTDVVNPLDFRDRTAANTDSPHIPVLQARGLVTFGKTTLEGVFVPFFKGHRMADYGNRWGFFYGNNTINRSVDYLEQEIGPGLRDELNGVFGSKFAPKIAAQNVSGGGRIAYRDGGLDLHLNGFYGWDRFPVMKFDPAFLIVASAFEDGTEMELNLSALSGTVNDLRTKQMNDTPIVTARYERSLHVGGDFSFTHEKLVVKGELLGSPKETIYTTGSQRARLATVSWAGGFDYTPIQEITITAEGFGRYLLGALPPEEDSRFGTGEDFIAAGGVRYVPQNGKLSVQVGGTYSIKRKDYRVQPRVGYQIMPELLLSVGASLLGGPENSYGGAYGENDHVFFRFDWLAL